MRQNFLGSLDFFIQNELKQGIFRRVQLGKYVEWLNIVYDELFENDVGKSNEVSTLFKDGYNKYDNTIKKLDGIKKSPDNYDLRHIEQEKTDFLLLEDFLNDEIDSKKLHEYTISLPFYYYKKYQYSSQKESFYKVLDLKYEYKQGLLVNDDVAYDFI